MSADDIQKVAMLAKSMDEYTGKLIEAEWDARDAYHERLQADTVVMSGIDAQITGGVVADVPPSAIKDEPEAFYPNDKFLQDIDHLINTTTFPLFEKTRIIFDSPRTYPIIAEPLLEMLGAKDIGEAMEMVRQLQAKAAMTWQELKALEDGNV